MDEAVLEVERGAEEVVRVAEGGVLWASEDFVGFRWVVVWGVCHCGGEGTEECI